MELDEMKNLWGQMSSEIEKQKKLTDTIIIKMTEDRYKNRLKNIAWSEAVGTLVCFAGLLLILINFQILNTWYLAVAGSVSAFFLLILPILSLRSLSQFRNINISGNNYKETLMAYAQGKKRFLFIQKLSFYLNFILILLMIPVMGKIIAGKDLLTETKTWIWFAPLAIPLYYYFARWVLKGYTHAAHDAENILAELNS
ncbi:MAG: hypothetical protein ACOYXT_05760 [Bacteroidota bacterium]